jgi:tryptophanyl-tRNA synthetase
MSFVLSSARPGRPAGPARPAASASLQASQHRSDQLEGAITAAPARFRVLTGDRPTGPLHVGHLFGSLLNRVRLQDLGASVIVLIADLQAITDRDAPRRLPADVLGLVADYLAAGLDPARTVIFAHSQVPELNQLLLPFLSLVSVAEVGRNPTVKEEAAAAGGAMSALMFSYPVHQSADILAVRAQVVPVGQDQLPHLELTRTIARRFNERYAPGEPYFPEPAALLSRAPLLLGLDGARKMGKSLRNSIPLGASADETARLIRTARTDAHRRISYDPAGRPGVSNLLLLASLCLGTTPQQVAEQVGDAGAVALKRLLTDAVNERLSGLRRRRAELAADPGYLRAVLVSGNERAREIAGRTLAGVRARMHTAY